MRAQEDSRERRLEAQEREILRTERRILTIADFIALLMVAATAFSAFATWRTEQMSELMFATADRPIIGVEKVTFERVDTEEPAIVVDFRNFGPVPADGAVIRVMPLLDGKPIALHEGETSDADQGVVSPSVPHFLYKFMRLDEYHRAVSGTSRLMVRIRVDYQGPGRRRRYCYDEKALYDSHLGLFRSAGGTTSCGNTDIY